MAIADDIAEFWSGRAEATPRRRPVRRGRKHVPSPCFAAGTLIATDRGAVAVEDLAPGDRVLTRDNGYAELRWIGGRHFDRAALAARPELRPLRIARGALGPGVPARDLVVSPQHRVLLCQGSRIAPVEEGEMLAAAADLADLEGVVADGCAEVTYFHLLFDAHEIVCAEGCWSESFLPEKAVLDGLDNRQYREIVAIFPELAVDDPARRFCPARRMMAPRRPATRIAA